jgi:hypothetical protein
MVDGFCHIRTNKKTNSCTIASHFSLYKKTRRKIKRNFIGANLYVTKPFSIKISGTSTGIIH